MIENAFYLDTKVVVRYSQPTPKHIKTNGKDFIFSCEHGVSLAFVDEEDVNSLLSYLGGCCGKRQQVIFLATESVYKHWLNGNGGR